MDSPSPHDTYTSPLASRNASPQMLRIWSPRHKFNTWRRIWLAIAQAQHEVTQDWPKPLVTAEQVEELRAVVDRGITDAELDRAAELERDLRHDVMAHVHCLGEQCPKAKPIIHLGCTSQDIVCNADMIFLSESSQVVIPKLVAILAALGILARKHASLPTLSFTHYQPAQPTTAGRRFAHWANDLYLGGVGILYSDSENAVTIPSIRGFRGATGTQASFLNLFNGDSALTDRFEAVVICNIFESGLDIEEMRVRRSRWQTRWASAYEAATSAGDQKNIESLKLAKKSFDENCAESDLKTAQEVVRERMTVPVTGQTYPRILDAHTLTHLGSVAAVLHKIATDIRLLSNRKEIDEPFGDKQIGSSAMPYKRNPMKCERICGLTRFVMNLVGNAYDTAATQWLERTLDDSSNRRLSLPEAFLALDGALDLMHEVASGLIVNEAMVRKNLMAELPFLATENILMEAVKLGGDRQDLHEKIRVHAQAAGHRVKQEGLDNDLIERLRNDPAFAPVHHLLTEEGGLLDPMKYIGRSIEQTERFIAEVIEPLREQYAEGLDALESSDRGV